MASDDVVMEDIDFSIDDPEMERIEAETRRIDAENAAAAAAATAAQAQAQNGTAAMDTESGEVQEPIPEKINLRGLDHMKTDDIDAFAKEHFPGEECKVEWVNDHSANLAYRDPETAAKALVAFTSPEIIDVSSVPATLSRKARHMPGHPDAEITVRQTLVSDKKKPRAWEESRFYLMHPEYDRHEQRQQNRRGGRGRRRGAGDDRGDYNRRRYDDEDHRRGRQANPAFDENMYDDDTTETTTRNGRRSSESPSSDYNRNRPRRRRGSDLFDNRNNSSYSRLRGRSASPRNGRTGYFGRGEEDLFSTREKRESSYGRLRDRSASPIGDGDGRLGFSEEPQNSTRQRARRRSPTPPVRRVREPVELFPSRQREGGNLSGETRARDLFASKLEKKAPIQQQPKELFPNKTDVSNHRRTDAMVRTPNKRDLFDRIEAPKRDLFDRVSRDESESTFGRLERPGEGMGVEQEGFKVKGKGVDMEGFSIRGAAGDDGGKKDLFAFKLGEKIKGRGGPRRRAEEMF